MLQNRLSVLKSVEDQLKESIEDIEVEGTFVTTSELLQMFTTLNEKSQNLWDNIKARLMHVMQRPYKMFAVKEISEEEQQFKLLNDKLVSQIQVKDHELLFLSKQNEVLQDKLQLRSVVKEEVAQKIKVQEDAQLNNLIKALCKFQTDSSSILSFHEDWQVFVELLKSFEKQKDVEEVADVSGPSTSELQKSGSKEMQTQLVADAVDKVIDAVITGMIEQGTIQIEGAIIGKNEDQNKEGDKTDV